MKRILLIIVMLALVGCASMDASGPKFVKQLASSEKSLIYLFKPDSASKDAVTTCLALTLNKVEYGCVRGKGYIVVEVEPGSYQAALINKASFGFKLLEFDINLNAGETSYLEYAFDRTLVGESLDTRFANFGVVLSGDHVIAKVKEDDALAKLNELFLSQ